MNGTMGKIGLKWCVVKSKLAVDVNWCDIKAQKEMTMSTVETQIFSKDMSLQWISQFSAKPQILVKFEIFV